FLMPLRCTGLELRWARARAALAAAEHGGSGRWTRRALLDDVQTQVRAIEKDPLAIGRPVVQLLRAGVAHVEGRVADASASLRAAIAGFDRTEMALHREAARLSLAHMTSASAGAAQTLHAETWMRERGVARPWAMAAAVAPGLGVSPRGGIDAGRIA